MKSFIYVHLRSCGPLERSSNSNRTDHRKLLSVTTFNDVSSNTWFRSVVCLMPSLRVVSDRSRRRMDHLSIDYIMNSLDRQQKARWFSDLLACGVQKQNMKQFPYKALRSSVLNRRWSPNEWNGN